MLASPIAELLPVTTYNDCNKNSSGDGIANVNFYAVRPKAIPEFDEITQNNAIAPFKVTDFGTNRKLIYISD